MEFAVIKNNQIERFIFRDKDEPLPDLTSKELIILPVERAPLSFDSKTQILAEIVTTILSDKVTISPLILNKSPEQIEQEETNVILKFVKEDNFNGFLIWLSGRLSIPLEEVETGIVEAVKGAK